MVTQFPVTRTAAPVLRSIGLEPEAHLGALEVIGTILSLHIGAQQISMARDDFQKGMESCVSYWRFQVELARDFAPSHLPDAHVPDRVFCALMGGVDLLLDNRIKSWKTDGARSACRIMVEYGNLRTADAFAAAAPETRYVAMMDTYCDLCAAHALMEADPTRFARTPLGNIDGMGMAAHFRYPQTDLTDAIISCEHALAARWREVYIPEGYTAKPRLV